MHVVFRGQGWAEVGAGWDWRWAWKVARATPWGLCRQAMEVTFHSRGSRMPSEVSEQEQLGVQIRRKRNLGIQMSTEEKESLSFQKSKDGSVTLTCELSVSCTFCLQIGKIRMHQKSRIIAPYARLCHSCFQCFKYFFLCHMKYTQVCKAEEKTVTAENNNQKLGS